VVPARVWCDADDSRVCFAPTLPARYRRAQNPTRGVVDRDLLAAQRNDCHDRLAARACFAGDCRCFTAAPGGACCATERERQTEASNVQRGKRESLSAPRLYE